MIMGAWVMDHTAVLYGSMVKRYWNQKVSYITRKVVNYWGIMEQARTQGWPGGGVINWLLLLLVVVVVVVVVGGGVTRGTGVHHRPRRVWGHAPPEFCL